MDKEIWQWVVGYEGLYLVSSNGRILGVPMATTYGHELSLAEKPKDSGYLSVCLCKNNEKRYFRVHRLVAQAFIPNLERKPEVNHKNGNRSDNRVENLEFARKLTDEQAQAIRDDDRPSRQIALEYNISKTTVLYIKKGKVYGKED